MPPLDPYTSWSSITERSLIAAPTLLASGWIILLPTLGKGPTRAWTLAHYLLPSGYATFAPAIVGLHHRVHRQAPAIANVGAVCVFLSLPTLIGQLQLDVVSARQATTQQDMDAFFGRIQANPLLAVLFYRGGPPFFFIGLMCLVGALVRARAVGGPLAVMLALGIVCIVTGQLRRRYGRVLIGHLLLCGLAFVGPDPRSQQHGAVDQRLPDALR